MWLSPTKYNVTAVRIRMVHTCGPGTEKREEPQMIKRNNAARNTHTTRCHAVSILTLQDTAATVSGSSVVVWSVGARGERSATTYNIVRTTFFSCSARYTCRQTSSRSKAPARGPSASSWIIRSWRMKHNKVGPCLVLPLNSVA